ncbi:MAG TPA: PDZ domain-containing protein [candidate division Zixibacteria bacterium]|nr:PDZ domain-containing protein [candidate division Zixibacteria bacterium]
MKYILILLNILSVAILATDSFVGIGTQTSEEPSGIEITQVVRNSPAEISGIEVGDVITQMNGEPIPDREALNAFLKTRSPGDLLKVTIDRCGITLRLPLILANRESFQGSMKKGGREDFPVSASALMPEWRADLTAAFVLEELENNGLAEEYANLAEAFRAELESYRGHFTLDAVALPMLEPVSACVSAETVIWDLSARGGDPLNIWAGVPLVLDVDTASIPIRPEPGTLEGIIETVRRANAQIDSAFANLTGEQLENIANIGPYLFDILQKTVYIDNDPDEDLVENYFDMVDAAKSVEYRNLLASGLLLAGLFQPQELMKLREIRPGPGADIERNILIDSMVVVAYADSTGERVPVYGRLLVTGEGDGIYDEQATIWIDLGGNDIYRGFCGGTPYVIKNGNEHLFAQGRIGVHIDLGGDDTYIRNTPGAIGAGYCGGACLIDLDGDDKYMGDQLCMGAAYFGTGSLIDMRGNDLYIAQENSQGFGLFGAGLLYDATGDDIYQGARYVQGVGMTKGLGILADHEGNDSYTASFKSPSGYGNEDTWDGWSQGVGMGFRRVSAGGIGLLIDRNGDDIFKAGNFSQACGYFFGLGILDDGGGNDVFEGNRYVQGSGAHQAVGYFRNHAGNDVYIGKEATNQAGTWDITTAYFIDDSGDDSYTGSGLSLGGAAQNGFAVFIDRSGRDTYRTSSSRSVGMGGGNDYHPDYDARSLGIFIDLDGQDDYSGVHDKRKNAKTMVIGDDEDEKSGVGLFIDK